MKIRLCAVALVFAFAKPDFHEPLPEEVIHNTPEWKGERGRVDDLIRKYADTLELTQKTTTAYLCGNAGMIVNARGILRRCGFEQTSIKEETYWPPGEGEVEY